LLTEKPARHSTYRRSDPAKRKAKGKRKNQREAYYRPREAAVETSRVYGIISDMELVIFAKRMVLD
jgi:hypothetical protein